MSPSLRCATMTLSRVAPACVLLLLATGAGGDLFAQEVRPPDGSNYPEAQVYLPDNSRFDAEDVTFLGEQLTYRRAGSDETSTLPLDDVAAVRVKAGNEGLRWLAYGAGVGAGAGLSAAYQLNNTSGLDTEADYATWILGGAAVTGLIMYAIGSSRPVWRGVYSNTASVSMAPMVAPDRVGVVFRLTSR